MPESPIRYAERYYVHYPNVSFGIWPPLFHFTEAAWFIVVPPSKASAFLLQAVITGLIAAWIAILAMRRFGALMGVATGVAVVALPGVRIFTGMILADNLMSLMAICATIAFAAYLRSNEWRPALLAGLFIGLTVMAKSNGVAVALLPITALLLMRRYRWFLFPKLWAAGGIALLIAVPWQLLVIPLWTGTTQAVPYSWHFVITAFREHLRIYWECVGAPLVLLGLAGVVIKVVVPYFHRRIEPFWACAAGLVFGFFAFGFAPLPPEARYHVGAFAMLVLFAAAALHECVERIPARIPRFARTAVAIGIVAILFAGVRRPVPKRNSYGLDEAARLIVRTPDSTNSVALVSSENSHEGSFVAELALLDTSRPTRYVLRATKMLSQSRWNLDRYRLKYQTPEAVQEYLKSVPVRYLVIDETAGRWKLGHHALLKSVVERYTSDWMPVGSYPTGRNNDFGGRVQVYELRGAGAHRKPITIELPYTLGKQISE
jgi:hypothetical protein